ncbi:MAG: hypothetical protein NT003_04355 [Candidatus Magasanikbacteria bacterium]|nr:hypothetical protein [Candidatus Magasanikbacteria bacterium]
MTISTSAQLHQALENATNALVLCRPNPSHDELAASMAMAERVRALGKQADVVSDGFSSQQAAALKFIPEIKQVKSDLGPLHDFIISVDLPGDSENFHTVRHELVDGKFQIHLTPKSGIITPAHVTTSTSNFRYDAIIVVGVQNLEMLGATYTNHTALFDATPIFAIDNSPANEHFGHINIVDITRASISEVVHALFAESHENISVAVATMLLTGMIAATQSFKTPNVNARTLQTASILIGLGADREIIVHHLYRQRSVATLKLWGAALTHLQTDPQQPIMWSVLTREDFTRAGATEADLNDLIDELIYTSPTAKVFALIYERPEKPEHICAIVDAKKPYHADTLTSGFTNTRIGGNADRTLCILTDYDLNDGAQRVINVLRAKMRG